MATDLLLKKLPQDLHSLIEKDSFERRATKKAVVIEALRKTYQPQLWNDIPEEVIPPSHGVSFKFIDLFSGIGGLRLGLQSIGGTCVFSSEWDSHSQKTYREWFGDTPHGDITQIPVSEIPDHDILAAGFPCQPFSIAGVSKKNSLGKSHGFECETQGTLFFHLANIIQLKRPPILLLENVKNLQSHDKGQTWRIIRETLSSMNYTIFTKVIDAAYWVPQHRERIFIVGFDKTVFDNPLFDFPIAPSQKPAFRSIMELSPDPKYTLTDHLWTYLQDYAKRHKEKGNGFGFGLVDLDGVSRTLSARYYKDGSEVLIPQEGKNPRRLTPREAARLMGYPDHLPIIVSDTQAYRQFGNSVVPAVVEAVAGSILRVIHWQLAQNSNGCLLKKP